MKRVSIILLSALMLVACGTTASLPTSQSSSTTYKIGDPYNQNGVKGIVVSVDETGKHGLIMSLSSTKGKWLSNNDLKYSTNAFFDDDGEKNMEAVANCIKESNASWSDFPAFEWARLLGNGWYIPSRVEARAALLNLQAAFQKRDISKTAVTINKLFTSYGGDRIIYHDNHISGFNMIMGWLTWNDARLKSLITSTEREGGENVWDTDNWGRNKTVPIISSSVEFRAVHKF